MRLTVCLLAQHIGRGFKEQWKLYGHRRIIQMQVSDQLKKTNVQIVDALEHMKDLKKPFYNCNELPAIVEKMEPVGSAHPDWHERTCLFFTSETNLLEGEVHCQQLTKTIKFSGMPDSLQQIYDRLDVNHLDDVAQNCIQNSLLHDAYQKWLPKIVDKERLWYTFPIAFGIPKIRKCNLLLRSFLRMVEMNAIQRDADAIRRNVIIDSCVSTPLEKDGHLIQYRVDLPTLVVAPTLMSEFANSEEVNATAQKELPDIYPLHYILDLKPQHVYKSYDLFPITRSSKPQFVHTILLHNDFNPDQWSRSQMLARAIGICHAVAVAQARAIFGNDVSELPHPISLQCVQTDSQTFDFVAYQLNTLNHSGTDGVKNCVWVDDSHKLFETCKKEKCWNHFEGFNNDVVRRFLTFYLNGLKMN